MDHDKTLYDVTHYDFHQLATKFPEIQPFLTAKSPNTIKNTSGYLFSHEGQFALTKAILQDQFDLDIGQCLKGHLCPPVPSRVLYLSIVRQVLVESGTCDAISEKIRGLDIGTGAYGIYAILGYKIFGWSMVGDDIDDESIANADLIVKSNRLDDNIEILKHDGIIDDQFTFTVCNPPFYDSKEEILENIEDKDQLQIRPNVVGTTNELIYAYGGEVGFILKLFQQSLKLKNIIWFSSLVGKKSSLSPLLEQFANHTSNFFIKEYQIGNTKRWIIFWSFNNFRPIVAKSHFKNIPITIVHLKLNVEKLLIKLEGYSFLDVKQEKSYTCITSKFGDVWSRSFRRRIKFNPKLDLKKDLYIFTIDTESIQWKYGNSIKTFQSFSTFIAKCMSS